MVSCDDGSPIEQIVGSAVAQECPAPFEVIVVTAAREAGAIVRERFPDVRLLEIDQAALPGEARNAGLRIARGTYVSFPSPHVELAPWSVAERVLAHELGYAMVTGNRLNRTTTLAGWASYFLDHSQMLPGRPSGPLSGAPDQCSYLREALVAIGGFPEDVRGGEEAAVNRRLFSAGYGAYRAREITIHHSGGCRTAGRLLAHHFERGRDHARLAFSGAANDDDGHPLAHQLPPFPLARAREVRRDVAAWGPELSGQLRAALPLVFAAATSAWLGSCYERLLLSRKASGAAT